MADLDALLDLAQQDVLMLEKSLLEAKERVKYYTKAIRKRTLDQLRTKHEPPAGVDSKREENEPAEQKQEVVDSSPQQALPVEDAGPSQPPKKPRTKRGERPPADQCSACWYETTFRRPDGKLGNPRGAHSRENPLCRFHGKGPCAGRKPRAKVSSACTSDESMGSDSS